MNRPRNRWRRRIATPGVSPSDIEFVKRLQDVQALYLKSINNPAGQREAIKTQVELVMARTELVVARVGSGDVLAPLRHGHQALAGVDSNRIDPVMRPTSDRRSKLPIAEVLFRALAAAIMQLLMNSKLRRDEAAREAARLLKSGPYAEKDARGYQIQDWRKRFRQEEFGTGTAVYDELVDPAALQPGSTPRQKAIEYARRPPVPRIRRR